MVVSFDSYAKMVGYLSEDHAQSPELIFKRTGYRVPMCWCRTSGKDIHEERIPQRTREKIVNVRVPLRGFLNRP